MRLSKYYSKARRYVVSSLKRTRRLRHLHGERRRRARL